MPSQNIAPFSHVMDLLLDAVCVVDREGRFLFVSAAGERIFGYTAEEMLGRPMIELVHPEDRQRTLGTVDEIVGGKPQPHFENRYLRKDGSVAHIMWSARWSEADQVRVAVARDVSERKRAEAMQAALYAISEAAHASADLLALFGQVHQIIGRLLPAPNFLVALYDAQQERLNFPYFVDEHLQQPAPAPLDDSTLSAALVREGQARRLTLGNGDAEAPHADVGPGPLDWLGVPLHGQKGIVGALAVKRYAGSARYADEDIELLQYVSTQVAAAIERKQTDSWLQHIARHDTLTGLPNRELFQDRCHVALAHARRDQTRLALLYLDLDMFKQINDSLGHQVGDLLLQEVAQRLGASVRDSDTVGRIGGDEFMVLIHSVQQPEHALLVAEKIRAAIAEPFALAGQSLSVAASIGVALYPEHGEDHARLMRHADGAMYEAKKEGGNRFKLADFP